MSQGKEKRRERLRVLGFLLLAAAVLLALSFALKNVRREQDSLGRDLLEDAIRRSAAACYASEGVYPRDLDYLTEHYGLQIDGQRYIVHYEVYAENLMPDITVVERADG